MTDFIRPASKYSSTDHRQVEIIDALVLYIAGDLVPLSVVESHYLSNLVKNWTLETSFPVETFIYQVPWRKVSLNTKWCEKKPTEFS